MRDRGVGEQPLDVGLGDGDDRADHHGEDGDHPERRTPVPGQAAERHVEDAQQRAEGRHHRAGRHQRGHRRRRALVDVRLPALEGHRADLEQQPDAGQRDAGEQQRRVGGVAGRRGGDRGEPHRAGEAVQHRDAEQEERRGERAEQEVLHGRLVREEAAAPGQTAQQVQRQRQHLERDEHGQQVVRGREEHHPADREQRQREDLGVHDPGGQALALLRAARRRGRHARRTGCCWCRR